MNDKPQSQTTEANLSDRGKMLVGAAFNSGYDVGRRSAIEQVVAWMRMRAEPKDNDDQFCSAWRSGVMDIAAEIEANEAEGCGHVKST